MLRDIDPQILITSHMIIFVMSLKDQKLFIVHVGMADSDNSMDSLVVDSESDDSQSTTLSSVADEELLLASGLSAEVLPYHFKPEYERLEETGESSSILTTATKDTDADRVGNIEW